MSTVDITKMREERSDSEFVDALAARDFHRALALTQERLDERRARFGDEHTEIANALSDMALALSGSGDIVTAAEVSLQALELEERLHGAEHERVGEALHRLAQLQLDAHNTLDAVTLFQRAVHVLERAVAEDDTRIAVACSGLAAALAQNGDLAGAASAMEKALQCYAVAGGPENADMLAPLEALSQLREAEGGLKDALSLRDRATRISKRARPADVPRHLLAAARLCIALGNSDRARVLTEETLELEQRHTPARAEAHAMLGELFERQQEFLRARDQYRNALETYRLALPEKHPQIAVALMNVATLEVALGEAERAEPLARDALSIFLDTFGPTHSHTRQMREGLRHAFLDSGHERMAAELASFGLQQ